MIAQISGKLLTKTPTASVIDCAGVGYEVFHSPFTAEKLQSEVVSLFIHTHMREDALQLYGFSALGERNLFRELLKVNGVGPKLAISIMSGLPFDDLLIALQSKDIARLQKIPGVGKKTAERLVMEIGDRVQTLSPLSMGLESYSSGSTSPHHMEAELESVLLNLGYQKPEIAKAVKSARSKNSDPQAWNLESLIKAALRELTQVKNS